MKLGAKFACALAAVFLALFGAAWLVLDQLVRADFQRVEAEQHEHDVLRVEASLASYRRELSSRVSDYGDWDDTRAFLLGALPSYPAQNFSPNWFVKYNIDLALFVDAKHRTAWGRVRTADGRIEQSPFLFNVVLSEARAGGSSAEEPLTGVTWTQHGPLFYAARATSDSSATAPPLGLIVFGKYLSVERLREQTQLNIEIFNIATRDASPSVRARLKELAGSNKSQIVWSEDGRRATLIALRGADGRVVGAVLARHNAAINPLGQRTIMVTAGLLACLFALALLVLWRVFERQIGSRLRALERHFNGQGEALRPTNLPASKDEIGRLITAFNALVDRTHHALANEQQALLDRESHARAYQLKSAFIANMSHELRTPLTAIMGYCDLMQEELAGGEVETCRADLLKIENSARDLLGLIETILDMSKIESGEVEIAPRPFSAAEMLKAAMESAMPAARRNGNTLSLQCLGDLGFGRTDEARLRQCVGHLLSNACKFTRDGEIVLRAERMRIDNIAWLRIEVHDSGMGMSAEQITRIFEPFTQADGANARQQGGMGLGLAITKGIVTLLGGTIAARSRPGYGTMFVISVPAVFGDVAAARDAA